MGVNVREIARILLHFILFVFSFYALSGFDFSKIMLNTPQRGSKAQTFLILASMALAYLAAQFILSLTYNIAG